MVVKRFKVLVGEDVSKVHTMEAYCEQMEVQTIAAFMAEHFNQELKKLSRLTDYKTVQFTAVPVLRVGDSTYYNMEQWLEGRRIRYSNNVNYVNTKEYAATLHAFSHWTYQRSDGLLMVQVEDSKGKNVFMLCDPAVHCKHVYRYARTKTIWSRAGMDIFFETHQCNNICRSLNLKPKSSNFTWEGTVIK